MSEPAANRAIPGELRRWLVANAVIGPAIIDFGLGALTAHLTAASGTVATWPHDTHSPSLLMDMLATLFLLPLIGCLIVTAVVRFVRRRDLIPGLAHAGWIERLHARVPATPLRRGTAVGVVCLLALGPVGAGVLALVDPGHISAGSFLLYHAGLNAGLGLPIIPLLAMLALLDPESAPPEAVRLDDAALALEVVGVTKTFVQGDNEVVALDGVDLTIAPGSFVAIMGPSGSGKSTLLNICGALDTPTSGSVAVGGIPLSGLDEAARTHLRRDHIGFVFQFFNLLPTLTAMQNVMLSGLIGGQHPAASAARAEELLELVGMSDRAAHLPSQMSAGQQQRVSIARALYHRPTLLLADEPTGSLDADSAGAVLDVLRDLADQRQTVLMITHNLDAAAAADRIVRLHHGRFVPEASVQPAIVAG